MAKTSGPTMRAAPPIAAPGVSDVDDDDDDDAGEEELPAVGQGMPTQTMPAGPPGPRPQAKRRPRSVQDVMQEFDDWSLALRRAFAGYNSLMISYSTFMDVSLTDEQRLARLPLLKFSASATGRDANEIVIDVKKVDPQHVQSVLVPLIQALKTQLDEATAEVQKRLSELTASGKSG